MFMLVDNFGETRGYYQTHDVAIAEMMIQSGGNPSGWKIRNISNMR